MSPTLKHQTLLGLNRSGMSNKFYTYMASKYPVPAVPTQPQWTLMDKVLEWPIWAVKNIGHLGNTHFPNYNGYLNSAPDNGIYTLPNNNGDPITIALLSDWATDTVESQTIGSQASSLNPDYSIHMGDTYFTGEASEIVQNFVPGGRWPFAGIGNFALIGNHEMYSGGFDYVSTLLPAMKLKNGSITSQQKAPFFCLENKYWRIIALDTGYYSVTGFFGLTDNTNMDLHTVQQDWLKKTVFTDPNDKRGVIFLSHHQYFTAFPGEKEFPNPAKTLAGIINNTRPVLWLWGHEHRFSIYGCNASNNGINAFGRCIGHGGMPVEILDDFSKINKNKKLALFDNRFRTKLEDTSIGYNGYAVLKLLNNTLSIEYRDYSPPGNSPGTLLVSENWEIDITTGLMKGLSINDYTNGVYSQDNLQNLNNSVNKLAHFTNDISDAITFKS